MNISKKSINAKLNIISAKNIHNKNKRLWLRQKEIKDIYITELINQKRNTYYSINESIKYQTEIISKLSKQFKTNNRYLRKLLNFTIV